MSDFLFILPEGWSELPKAAVDAIPAGISAVQMWIDTNNFAELTAALHDCGQLPLNQYLEEAKMFNGEILVARIITQ